MCCGVCVVCGVVCVWSGVCVCVCVWSAGRAPTVCQMACGETFNTPPPPPPLLEMDRLLEDLILV